MSDTGVVYIASGETQAIKPEPGVLRQVLAYNPELMLVRHTYEKGWKGARHSHTHCQMMYVVSGYIRLQAKSKNWKLRPGDSIIIEGGVEHETAALDNSEVLDIFMPFREDYIKPAGRS
ncbi:MAG: cupin domain-containing protein [Terracidiphilus sp.]